MSENEIVGVLEQERRRVQAWKDAGLPDPVAIVSIERFMRELGHVGRDWRHAHRDEIDAFIAEHGVDALPNPLPNGY